MIGSLAGAARRCVKTLSLLLLLAAPWYLTAALDEPPASAELARDFTDQSSRQRYNRLVLLVQCPNCEGSPVASSPSPFARAIAQEIAQRIKAGESDEAILDYLVSRYGPAIVSAPPVQASTLPLYLSASILLALGAGLGLRAWRRLR